MNIKDATQKQVDPKYTEIENKVGRIQLLESHITSWTADMASKKQPKRVKAIEMATWSQKLCKVLQKFGRDACLIPVRFRLLTPEAADPALIIAYANNWNSPTIPHYISVINNFGPILTTI